MPKSYTALKALENNLEASLYIHIPFCNSKCSYCDFFSVTDHSLMSDVLDKTIAQTAQYIDYFGIKSIPTVYIGGGTPTSLPLPLLERLLDFVGTLPLSDGAECTVEANPETVSPDLLTLLSSSCINRLSLGIQSFSKSTLKILGRHCDFKTNFAKLELVKSKWHGKLSLDLIASVPHQAVSDSIEDIDTAVSFKPDHISLYALTLEEGTPLFRLYSGDLDAIDDNVWIIAADHLEVLGYRRYEVSNFSLPGCQSRHNTRYWKLKPYIGTGAGGVSTLHTGDGDLFRIANVPSLERYLASDGLLCGAETEEVAGKSYIFEYLMMGLRMTEGIDKSDFRRTFGREITDTIPETLSEWKTRGLAVETENSVVLSRQGLLLLNQFLLDALSELE
ncbi:MAG: radical SAM family heme chaperone HemW [Spirochaetia bacterium]|nr:radical SAM family heme chaperone HemW [Spirochaetia bacterium]